VRGELVRLNATWQEVLQRHEYPGPIKNLLGQMMAATALLESTIKFQGSLIMQVQGKGPLTLAVTECTSEKTMRAIARWNEEALHGSLTQIIGTGTLAITIMPTKGRRYQGIVDVSSGDLASAIEDYMFRSQQLNTKLWLFADDNLAAGMLLQKMPEEEAEHTGEITEDADAWNRFTLLADTIKQDELTQLPFQEIVRRLFAEEDVRLFDIQPMSFRCYCSAERVRNTLRMLGYDEVASLLKEQEKVEVNCEFCNPLYVFDKVDVEQMFASGAKPHTPPTRH
jgi:molecular chaperone Hsp33